MHSAEAGEDDPGYARQAYSTRTGPTTGETPADNHFALVVEGRTTHRGAAVPAGTGPGWAASRHTPHPGVRVLSATLAHGRAEVRAHLVLGAPEGTPVRQTGWATTPGGPSAQLHPVHGYPADGEAVELRTGETLQGPGSRTLALHGVTDGPAALFVALASLTAEPDPAPVAELANVRVTGRTLRVTWRNGTTARLDLDALDTPDPPEGPDPRDTPDPHEGPDPHHDPDPRDVPEPEDL